ncbi:hypothetical protein V8E53_013325 [Lactarius tabidus]
MITEGYKSPHTVYFYWCNALEAIEYIFGNLIFVLHMQFDPQRLWSDQLKTECIYSEYMTGDFAWESQDKLPDSLEMYLAYLTLANIISRVCMKASNRAWMTFTFLPIVKFIVHPDFQSILSAFVQCKEATMNGCYMADPHGFAWTADLPEQHLISAIVNNASPLSLATTDQFGDNTCQPPCHGHETLWLIRELTQCVDPWQLDNFQKAVKAIGLSGAHLPFWRDWCMANPFHFLVPEILHMCHKFFYDHPLPWCINAIGACEFDQHFQSLHSCVKFHHFSSSITHVKQMTGHEHCDIQRSIMAVIAGAVPPRFLHAIHTIVNFIYQVQSPMFTETSISWFVNALREFHNEKDAIIEAGACMGTKGNVIDYFNIPKLEIWHHFAHSTRAMGP